jgi:glycosyltransferase involved in cell wall biosynthesis
MVATVHDFVIQRYPETCLWTNLLIKKALVPRTIKKSSGLVPVSDYVSKELVEFFPKLRSASKIIRTVNNAAKEEMCLATRMAVRENFLFFSGNMEPRKNLGRLIKALEIVNASGFEIDLHICGPAGWRNSDFYESIKSSPIKERIKLLGYLSDADLSDQYLKCKAFVYPSIYEGFGIPVLEALNHDTPVLTSKGTVMEEIAESNALYFDPYDVESIAATIIAFLKSGPYTIDKDILKKYSWKQSAKCLADIFEEVRKQV